MKQKTYFLITGIIFLIIGILHLLRIINGWFAQIGNWQIPIWFSWLGLIISALLSFFGFKFVLSKVL